MRARVMMDGQRAEGRGASGWAGASPVGCAGLVFGAGASQSRAWSRGQRWRIDGQGCVVMKEVVMLFAGWLQRW